MTDKQLDLILNLRQQLHQCPEISGQEVKTKALLQEFLRTHTTLELHPCGEGFYCAHREDAPKKPAIALRADFDALATPDGGAAHLCGHDAFAGRKNGGPGRVPAVPARGGNGSRRFPLL